MLIDVAEVLDCVLLVTVVFVTVILVTLVKDGMVVELTCWMSHWYLSASL